MKKTRIYKFFFAFLFLGLACTAYYYLFGQDVSAFLKDPPLAESAIFENDAKQYQIGKQLRSSERGKQAIEDADFYGVIDRFSTPCAWTISKEQSPAIYELLKYSGKKMYFEVTQVLKTRYHRVRPYVFYSEETCYKKDESFLGRYRSYPSGHSSNAWLLARILSDFFPERKAEIMKFAYEVGQSRVICGYHWQSDVEYGREIADEYYKKLPQDEKFQRLAEKVRREIAKAPKG